jgi:hypothetical protein
MRSIRKAALLVAVVAAAIAVMAPAAANAAVLKIGGKPASVGQTITGTSTNLWFQSSYGRFGCSQYTLSAKVTQNSGSVVEAVENAPGTSKGCTLGNYNISMNPTLKAFKLQGTGTGTLGLEFNGNLPGLVCTWINVGAPISYSPGGSTITISNMPFPAWGGCSNLWANGNFTWTSPGGKVVFE